MDRTKLYRNRLLIIFLAALALRLGYVFFLPHLPPGGDAIDYNRIAVNLAAGHGFSLNPGVPTPKRAPGFPFFLCLVYMVFGHSYTAVMALQALLGALTCVAAFRVAQKIFGDREAEIAGWLLALYPVLIAYTGLILSETLFTFLLAAAMMFWTGGVKDRHAGDFVLGGVFLGLATLTRPVTIVFPAVLLASSVLFNRGLFFKWLLFLAAFIAVTLPWSARNYRLWGTIMPCSVGTGYGFYVTGNMASGLSFDESFSKYQAMYKKYPEPEVFKPGPTPDIQLENRLQSEGTALIKANFRNYLVIVLKRLAPFWVTSHSSVFGIDKSLGEYRRDRDFPPIAARLALLAFHAALLALAAAGMFLTRKSWRCTAPFIALLVFFTGHIAFDFVPRYHLPVIPYMFIFSAAGISGLLGKYRRKA